MKRPEAFCHGGPLRPESSVVLPKVVNGSSFLLGRVCTSFLFLKLLLAAFDSSPWSIP